MPRRHTHSRPTNKEQRAALKAAELRGWRIICLRKGWRALAPDGVGYVTIHGTSSDYRAIANMRTDFKRLGLEL